MKGKSIIIAITALAVIASVLSACVFKSGTDIPEIQDGDGMERSTCPLFKPQYPEMAAYPSESGRGADEAFDKWQEDVAAQQRDLSFTSELNDFYSKTIGTFLSGSEGENKIVSPLNLYMALSMLSEITEGETKAELMDLIDCPDTETLRSRASDLWNSHYRRDGATSLTLANSLWLRNDSEYDEDCLKVLSENYYASSFTGNMGSGEYNAILRAWLNDETEGLLENSVQNEGFEPETLLALSSAICYRAKWAESFDDEDTAPAVFHAPEAELETDFMHSSIQGNYYYGDNFGAAVLELENGGGSMELILPDEESSINSVLSDPEFYDFINSDGDWDRSKFLKINLALPKFDIEAGSDLKEGMRSLGVNRVFEDTADFSPITESEGIYLSKANHAVRVAVDEEGVKAAAYTLMAMAGAGRPPEEEVDFTLDRPFIFIIRSQENQPLFAGTVYNP